MKKPARGLNGRRFFLWRGVRGKRRAIVVRAPACALAAGRFCCRMQAFQRDFANAFDIQIASSQSPLQQMPGKSAFDFIRYSYGAHRGIFGHIHSICAAHIPAPAAPALPSTRTEASYPQIFPVLIARFAISTGAAGDLLFFYANFATPSPAFRMPACPARAGGEKSAQFPAFAAQPDRPGRSRRAVRAAACAASFPFFSFFPSPMHIFLQRDRKSVV